MPTKPTTTRKKTPPAPKGTLPDKLAASEPRAVALPRNANIRPIIPDDYDSCWRLASGLSLAGVVPKQLPGPPGSETNIAATFAVIQQGATVGLPPMSALGAFTIINGRLVFQQGVFPGVDESGLRARAQEAAARLWKRL